MILLVLVVARCGILLLVESSAVEIPISCLGVVVAQRFDPQAVGFQVLQHLHHIFRFQPAVAQEVEDFHFGPQRQEAEVNVRVERVPALLLLALLTKQSSEEHLIVGRCDVCCAETAVQQADY